MDDIIQDNPFADPITGTNRNADFLETPEQVSPIHETIAGQRTEHSDKTPPKERTIKSLHRRPLEAIRSIAPLRRARAVLQKETVQNESDTPRFNERAITAFMNISELLNKLTASKALNKYVPILGGVLAALLPEILALKGIDVKNAFGSTSEIVPSSVIGYVTAGETKPVTRFVEKHSPENADRPWLTKADKAAGAILGTVVGSLASTASHFADTPIISTITNLADDVALMTGIMIKPIINFRRKAVALRKAKTAPMPRWEE